jgi:hypothetical protein
LARVNVVYASCQLARPPRPVERVGHDFEQHHVVAADLVRVVPQSDRGERTNAVTPPNASASSPRTVSNDAFGNGVPSLP